MRSGTHEYSKTRKQSASRLQRKYRVNRKWLRGSEKIILPRKPVIMEQMQLMLTEDAAGTLSGQVCFIQVSISPNRYVPPLWIEATLNSVTVADVPGTDHGGMVAREGIEPPTRGFSVRCSTN